MQGLIICSEAFFALSFTCPSLDVKNYRCVSIPAYSLWSRCRPFCLLRCPSYHSSCFNAQPYSLAVMSFLASFAGQRYGHGPPWATHFGVTLVLTYSHRTCPQPNLDQSLGEKKNSTEIDSQRKSNQGKYVSKKTSLSQAEEVIFRTKNAEPSRCPNPA